MKKRNEDKRFYVIVPEKVDGQSARNRRSVHMEHGRLMAQTFHIGRKIENFRARLVHVGEIFSYEEITAIVLSVRNSRELDLIGGELMESGLRFETWSDTNPSFYGTRRKVPTALCLHPVTKNQADLVLGHLELI